MVFNFQTGCALPGVLLIEHHARSNTLTLSELTSCEPVYTHIPLVWAEQDTNAAGNAGLDWSHRAEIGMTYQPRVRQEIFPCRLVHTQTHTCILSLSLF